MKYTYVLASKWFIMLSPYTELPSHIIFYEYKDKMNNHSLQILPRTLISEHKPEGKVDTGGL